MSTCRCDCHDENNYYSSPYNDNDEWIGCADCSCTEAEWLGWEPDELAEAADRLVDAMMRAGVRTVGGAS